MTLQFIQISIDKVKISAPYYLYNPSDEKYHDKPNVFPMVHYVRSNDHYSSRKVWVPKEHVKEGVELL